MTIKNRFPDVAPVLNLDFANTKRLDPRITFTRASTGTYVDEFGIIRTAAANQARFDHDGSGNSLGLLVEEARTNYKTISTTLNPGFVFTNTISPAPSATIVAPDGVSQTVEKLVEDTSTGTHNGALQISGTYDNWATSFFVKAAGRTRFKFDPRENGSFTEFDLTSGTVNGVVDSSRFEQLPNGWFRVKNFTVASFRAFSRWRLLDASGNESYTGDGVSGIYLWGFQWERPATFSSSYIPTSGSTVTRSADVASMTGTNFSSWYNQSEGTLSFATLSKGTAFAGYLQGASSTDRIEPYQSASYPQLVVVNSGTTIVNAASATPMSFITKQQFAVGIKQGAYALAQQGTVTITGTSSTSPPTITQMFLGRQSTPLYLNGTIYRLAYYDRRLTDAQLQALTL